MSFPRYERYKNAGICWLSEVPAHWQVIPNKALLRATNDLVGTNSSNFTLLSLTLFGVIVRDIESGKGKFPAEFDSYKAVAANDLIFCLFDLDETPRTIGLANQAGMITGAYEVLRCKSVALPSYICYFYLNVDGFKGLRPWYTGLRKVVRPDTFMSIKLGLPPLEEQAAISSFLDSETSKIDMLIEEQQRLIELLKEKRHAVISQAVTRGLNPDAKMKDSGISWLGDVPATWQVLKLKELCQPEDGIQMGPFGGMLLALDTEDTGFKVYGQQNTISGDFSRGNRWISQDRYARLEKYSLSIGDIVLTRKGSLGNARLVTEQIMPGIIDSDTIRIRLQEERASSSFITLLFHEALYIELEIETMKRGAILAGVNSTTIANLYIALPPKAEQDDLMKALALRLDHLKKAENYAKDIVMLLQERRSALISAAVTGKIDVRNYTPKEAA